MSAEDEQARKEVAIGAIDTRRRIVPLPVPVGAPGPSSLASSVAPPASSAPAPSASAARGEDEESIIGSEDDGASDHGDLPQAEVLEGIDDPLIQEVADALPDPAVRPVKTTRIIDVAVAVQEQLNLMRRDGVDMEKDPVVIWNQTLNVSFSSLSAE